MEDDCDHVHLGAGQTVRLLWCCGQGTLLPHHLTLGSPPWQLFHFYEDRFVDLLNEVLFVMVRFKFQFTIEIIYELVIP